jgi:hypothetical protein
VNIYEQVVELYMTQVEGCAVMPQLRIEKLPCGLSWKARPDFVAINFRAREVQIVEVSNHAARTRAAGAAVNRLASKLDPPYRGSLEAAVQEIALANRLRDWPFRWLPLLSLFHGAMELKSILLGYVRACMLGYDRFSINYRAPAHRAQRRQ